MQFTLRFKKWKKGLAGRGGYTTYGKDFEAKDEAAARKIAADLWAEIKADRPVLLEFIGLVKHIDWSPTE